MALSAEDRKEITELIVLSMQGNHARTEAQFTLIDNKLDAIKERVDKTNGTVLKHTKDIEDIKSIRDKKYQEFDDFMININDKHILNCPIAPRIRILEDNALTNKSIKKFGFTLFTGGIALGGLIVAIIKLFI